jgi:hemolysin-activating ACP:hemolysin acyltransferase
MFLPSQEFVPGELDPGGEAASAEARSPQNELAANMENSADSSSDPAAANPVRLPEAAADVMRQRFVAGEVQFALSFMRVVSVLSQSPHYRHYTLSDLEWLVVPPLRTGQCAILNAPSPGLPVALWASVSPEVDGRLSQNLTAPIRLRPDEWCSGEILWLIDVVGRRDTAQRLLSRLQTAVLAGKRIKARRGATDGSLQIAFLEPGSIPS